jgi:hypothetical protein
MHTRVARRSTESDHWTDRGQAPAEGLAFFHSRSNPSSRTQFSRIRGRRVQPSVEESAQHLRPGVWPRRAHSSFATTKSSARTITMGLPSQSTVMRLSKLGFAGRRDLRMMRSIFHAEARSNTLSWDSSRCASVAAVSLSIALVAQTSEPDWQLVPTGCDDQINVLGGPRNRGRRGRTSPSTYRECPPAQAP